MKSVLFFFVFFGPQKGERDGADARRCSTARVDGGGGRSFSEYTYSTVTTVFPASSETIENVLSNRKCVCVTGSTPGLVHEKKQNKKTPNLGQQRARSERRRGASETEGEEGSIVILTAQINRNTKDNIASSRTSFNCSVYIKLEESYRVILQLHFTLEF